MSLSTSISLIRRVRERDQVAWCRFIEVYGPLVYRWCRRRGIGADDAADLTQNVFGAVAQGVHRYKLDSERANFRGWLYGITAHKITDHIRRLSDKREVLAGDLLDSLVHPHPTTDTEIELSRDDRKRVVLTVVKQVQAEVTAQHWQAFWRTTVHGQSAPEVADELGLKPAMVRQAKCRILKRIRLALTGLENLEGSAD